MITSKITHGIPEKLFCIQRRNLEKWNIIGRFDVTCQRIEMNVKKWKKASHCVYEGHVNAIVRSLNAPWDWPHERPFHRAYERPKRPFVTIPLNTKWNRLLALTLRYRNLFYMTRAIALCVFPPIINAHLGLVLMTFSATVWTFSHDYVRVTLDPREINSTMTHEFSNKNEKIIRVQKILPGLRAVKEASHQKWHWNFLFSPLCLAAAQGSQVC